MENSIVIRSAKIARLLLKSGFRLIDIKPHKKDNKRSVFVFVRTEALLKELSRLTEQRNRKQKVEDAKVENKD